MDAYALEHDLRYVIKKLIIAEEYHRENCDYSKAYAIADMIETIESANRNLRTIVEEETDRYRKRLDIMRNK